MPKTFSDEIGDVHARRGDQPSFTNEFRGASDSLIRNDRPPGPLAVNRRSRRLAWLIVVLLALLGGGGWALYYWSEPIGEWIASWGDDGEAPAAPDEPAVVEPEPEPAPPDEPPRVFGVQGAPEDGGTPSSEAPVGESEAPVGESEAPVGESEAPPAEPGPAAPGPAEPAPTSVAIESTAVRGKVGSSTISARLAPVDTALKDCWRTHAKPDTKRPVELRLRFSIKWNGRSFATSVTGEAPEQVRSCVRDALPASGWPMPRDGGEAQVTRIWSLK